MRSIGLFTLVLGVVVLVGCSSGRPLQDPAPVAVAPMAQPMAQPSTQPVNTMPTGAAPGERVIKVIQLPKGQTPYDLPGA